MDSIEDIKRRLKNNNNKKSVISHKVLIKYIINILITLVLLLSTLIFMKISDQNRQLVYNNLFEKTFKFAPINYYYQKYLGDILPFQNIVANNDEQVFKEKLAYKEANKYNDGVKLVVNKNYLIPVLESGIVVFIGNKEKYGNTIIVQQTNGIDVWYGNIKNNNVQIYDYIEKGTLLGETEGETLYLVFQKEGAFLNYKDYIK